MPASHSRLTYSERLRLLHPADTWTFEEYLIRRSLYAPLRWIYPWFRSSLTDYLEPEIACAQAIARLRSSRDLENELVEYAYHPRNRDLIRRYGRQRLSTRRVVRLMRSLPRGSSAQDTTPFAEGHPA